MDSTTRRAKIAELMCASDAEVSKFLAELQDRVARRANCGDQHQAAGKTPAAEYRKVKHLRIIK